MIQTKDLTIGVLTITAVVLLVGIIIINTQPQPAYASGMTASGGDYIMVVGRVQTTPEDLLYLVDTVEEKMIVYQCNTVSGQVTIADIVNLKDLRKATTPKSSQQPAKRGPTPRPRGNPRTPP